MKVRLYCIGGPYDGALFDLEPEEVALRVTSVRTGWKSRDLLVQGRKAGDPIEGCMGVYHVNGYELRPGATVWYLEWSSSSGIFEQYPTPDEVQVVRRLTTRFAESLCRAGTFLYGRREQEVQRAA